MEFESNIEIVNLEQLTEDSNVIDEALGCGTVAIFFDKAYTKGMSMFQYFCRKDP